jgi:hypothetical protein
VERGGIETAHVSEIEEQVLRAAGTARFHLFLQVEKKGVGGTEKDVPLEVENVDGFPLFPKRVLLPGGPFHVAPEGGAGKLVPDDGDPAVMKGEKQAGRPEAEGHPGEEPLEAMITTWKERGSIEPGKTVPARQTHSRTSTRRGTEGAPRTGRGRRDTSGAPAKRIAPQVRADTNPERRESAPACQFIRVRLRAMHPGMPPKGAAATLDSPVILSSRSRFISLPVAISTLAELRRMTMAVMRRRAAAFPMSRKSREGMICPN